MRPPKLKSKCAICSGDGDGYHFGAEACKACTAFFRRSIQLKKTFKCRGNDDCNVTISVRCMCRSCRFSKCLQVGMNPMGVQLKIGSNTEDVPDTSSNSESSLLLVLPEPYNDSMPLLTKMRVNYEKLISARRIMHNKGGHNLFKEQVSMPSTYKVCIDEGIKDVSLTADWISWCFEDFSRLPIEQKHILFRNFYTPFFILESAFMSHLKNTPDFFVFPSGNYVDINDLESFYKDVEINQKMTREQFLEFLKPTYEMHRRTIIQPMMSENLDIFEFFALTSFVLWNTTLEETTEECSRIGKSIKDQIMKELSFYMRNFKRIEDPVIRVAGILNLIPDLYKNTRRIQDETEIIQVFDFYNSPKQLYDLVHGNFC
ncbi:Protein CBG03688 [Caenorhabditis briggsae]|uniref:Uncharacterized protein n=2 Tax=Caenorhabditis briggsae TaxID=6238 RepID=A0AAE9DGS3_CAEBR|nr:Protein CBG03688 [Caenorhabditis briggsae]ULU04080.1 hypothetical protein L3Y34_017107 [Caenorhabditis briggsae]CAP24525.2 Protein CBG03688 [Caenorhabditis briggsae]